MSSTKGKATTAATVEALSEATPPIKEGFNMSNSNSDLTIGANALTFNFSAQALRVVMIDGEPWFVAADVCAALGIQRTSDAVEKLDGDEKGTDLIHPITHKFFLFLKQRVRQKFREGKRLPNSFCTCQKYIKTAQSA